MERKQSRLTTLSTLFFIITALGCSGKGISLRGSGGSGSAGGSAGFMVTWTKGVANSSGGPTMGTVGVTDPSFYPFSVGFAGHTVDPSGNLWLYGGGAGTSEFGPVYDNLWKYDGTNWAFRSGSASLAAGAPVTFGTLGVAGGYPGRRSSPSLVSTSNGNIWLFGGWGELPGGSTPAFNDLWKYDGTNWTWVKGESTIGGGVYGTIEVTAPSNLIPPRYGAASWVDSSDNIWIFGGRHHTDGFNDLWKFNGTNWTWMKGTSAVGNGGNYGTMGATHSANFPGTRAYVGQWKTSDGTVYIFGGRYVPGGNSAYYKELWKYDGATNNWTWLHGTSFHSYGTAGNRMGTYGVKGVAASTNTPGARSSPTTWVDSSDNLWMFGGYGFDSLDDTTPGELQDLWKFDGSQWTWVAGSTSIQTVTARAGVYGTLGQGSASYIPSPRFGAIPWKSGTDVHIFGGSGYTPAGNAQGLLNDQWKFSW